MNRRTRFTIYTTLMVGVSVWCPETLAQTPEWSLKQGTTIGRAALQEAGLESVGHVLVHEGKVFVAPGTGHRIAVFTEEGDFVRSFGDNGTNPGEIWLAGKMGVQGDELWVESGVRRITFFDSEARFVSSSSIPDHPTIAGANAWVYGISSDGRFTIRYDGDFTIPHDGEPSKRSGPPDHVLKVGPDGSILDTVTVISGRRGMARVADGVRPGYQVVAPIPVSSESLFSMASDGSGSVVVHRELAREAGPHTYGVVRFDADADTVWQREFEYDPEGIPDQWVSDYMDWFHESDSGDSVRFSDPTAFARGVEETFRERKFFPAVEKVWAGESGTTWLLARGPDAFEYTVLDRDGRAIGSFQPPSDGELKWPGLESVWFEERDALRKRHLVRYAVARP